MLLVIQLPLVAKNTIHLYVISKTGEVMSYHNFLKLIIYMLLALTILALLPTTIKAQIPYQVPFGYTTTAKVSRIIDGDTFVLSDSSRVRLLGIDTPELNSKDTFYIPYANHSKLLLDSLINNKVVKLTFETKTRDMFDRILAYVWLRNATGQDSLFIQAEMLKRGLARIRYYPEGSKYYEIFYNLRASAMKNNLGIWSK